MTDEPQFEPGKLPAQASTIERWIPGREFVEGTPGQDLERLEHLFDQSPAVVPCCGFEGGFGIIATEI